MTSSPRRYAIDTHPKAASAVAHPGEQCFGFQFLRSQIQRVVFASSLICAAATTASAQTPGCVGPGWDHCDPVNITESRVYARLFYDFKETGVVSEEFANFRFTNPAPSGAMTPFYGAEEFFRKLYAHRLNSNTASPSYYTLHQLLRDDPAVQAAFRLYATTGKFETPFDDDFNLALNHLDAVVDASSAGVRFDFSAGEQAAIVAGELASMGLFLKAAAEVLPVVDPEILPPEVRPVDPQALAIKQRLPVVPAGTPYWPDGESPCPPGAIDNGAYPFDGFCCDAGHPGFDCDDYARAWAAWLKRNLTEYPNAQYFILAVYYGVPRRGHSVVAVLIDGKYYIVDPQSGMVRGPLDQNWIFPEDFGPFLREILRARYGMNPPDDVSDWALHPPDYIDPHDVPPWYSDPAVREWFQRMFPGQNPQEFVWPTDLLPEN